MALWRPTNAGPRTIRQLYHWVWRQFVSIGEQIGETDPNPPVSPAPTPGHYHWLSNLVDVDLESGSPVLKNGHGLWYDVDSMQWKNRSSFQETWPTGLVDGGELNIVAGEVEALAGYGVISDAYTNPLDPVEISAVAWEQINTPITAAPAVAGSIVWISIAPTAVPAVPPDIGGAKMFVGVLKQYATPPGPSLSRMEIFLGVLVHNGVEWREISNPKVINQSAETLREYLISVSGPSHIIQGGAVNEIPVFQLEQEQGTIWEQNRNWHVDKSNPNRELLPAQSPISFQYVNRDFTDVGTPTSTIVPDVWDNGGLVEPLPGPANTCTIQRLYLDPANNYWMLWGQYSYSSFQIAQANLLSENPVVPFILQNSILLGYVLSEKAKTDWDIDEAIFIPVGPGGTTAGAGTPITEFINLSDTPPSYGGQFPLVPVVNEAELALEFDYRTKAVGDYVEGITYNIGDEVFNGADLSEAKINGVQSYPFVAPTGDTLQIYQGTMPTDAKTAKQVIFGNRYTSLTKGFFINGYRVYTVVGNNYEVVSVTDPLGTPVFNQVASFTGTVNGWFDLPISSVAVGIGTVFDLLCTVSEPDPTPIEVIASYDYQTPQNPAAPLAGQIIQGRSLPSVLAISYTDAAAGDQTALIQGLSIGDIIRLGQVQYSVQTNTPQVGYSDLVVAPALTTTPIGIQDVTFETVATTPITIGEDLGYWPTSALPATQGLLGVDIPYPDIVPDDNAYGIDVAVQEAFIPDQTEWQLKIIGPLNGGGGGSGSSGAIFEGETPPVDAVAGDLWYACASPNSGLYYYFDDGDSLQWVPVANMGGGGGGDSYWTANGDDIVNTNVGDVLADGAIIASGTVKSEGQSSRGNLQASYVGSQTLAGTEVGRLTFLGETDTGSPTVLSRIQSVAETDLTSAARDSYLAFSTSLGAGTSERMRIASNGNVGIGTTTPEANLDVGGFIRATAIGNVPTTGIGLELFYNTNQDYAAVSSYDRDAGAYKDIFVYGNEVSFGSGAVSSIERMRIDSDGIVSGVFSDNSVSNPLSKLVRLTQAQYDALGAGVDPDTLYFIVDI